MKNRVLYFPYIEVPATPWMSQMLLYWDQVSSIVPYDFIAKPEELGHEMCDLVRQELVFQVSPGAYIPDLEDFDEAFGRHLERLSDLDARRERLEQGDTIRIHVEKLGSIRDRLKAEFLANEQGYPWLDVEIDTGNEFMGYLATVLGQLDDIDSTPVTDDEEGLRGLVSAGVAPSDIARQLSALRTSVLDKVLPVPRHEIPPSEIRDFRDKYGHLLPDFRRMVERELITLADIENAELKQRRLDIFFQEADEQITEITSRMQERGWLTTTGKITGVIIEHAVPVFGLAKAVGEAVAEDKGMPKRDFAYAAYAQELLQQVGDDKHEVA